MKNSRRFLVRITQYNLEGQIITHFDINTIYKTYTVGLSLLSLCKNLIELKNHVILSDA